MAAEVVVVERGELRVGVVPAAAQAAGPVRAPAPWPRRWPTTSPRAGAPTADWLAEADAATLRRGVRPAPPRPGRRPARAVRAGLARPRGPAGRPATTGRRPTLVRSAGGLGRRPRRPRSAPCRWPTTWPPTATARRRRRAVLQAGADHGVAPGAGLRRPGPRPVRRRRPAHRLRRQPGAPRAADGRRARLRRRPGRPHRRRRPAAAGQPEEVEIRACGLHAVELLAGRDRA